MTKQYVDIGCFTFTSGSLLEWIASRCQVQVNAQTFYIPLEHDIKALFELNGITLENEAAVRLKFLKLCRGYFVSDSLVSSLPLYLKRIRKVIAFAGSHKVIGDDLHAEAYRFALTVEPMKEEE